MDIPPHINDSVCITPTKNIVALFTLKNFLKYLGYGEYSAVPLSHGQFSQKHSQKTPHSSLARAMGVIFGFNDFLIFYLSSCNYLCNILQYCTTL